MEKNTNRQLIEALLSTTYELRAGMLQFLKPYDLSIQQYQVLEIIGHNERKLPLTTNEISAQMVDKHADTSRVVDRLIAKGLLQKKKCSIDARKVRVTLTIRGKDVNNRLAYDANKLDALTDGLNKVEKGWMVDLLQKLQ